MKPTDPYRTNRMLRKQLLGVLQLAYENGIAIQSDAARLNGQTVAAAASLGLITTRTHEGFGRRWRPTAKGLAFYEESPK